MRFEIGEKNMTEITCRRSATNCFIIFIPRLFMDRRKGVSFVGTSGRRVDVLYVIIISLCGVTKVQYRANTRIRVQHCCTLFEESRGRDIIVIIIILQCGWCTCEKTSSAYPHLARLRLSVRACLLAWVYTAEIFVSP